MELPAGGRWDRAAHVAAAVLVRTIAFFVDELLELRAGRGALQPPRLLVEAADGLDLLRLPELRRRHRLLEH